MKVEKNNNIVSIKILNETTKHQIDRHALLGKVDMKQHQFVTKGFEKKYDLNNPQQASDLFTFLNNFKQSQPTSGQTLLHPPEAEYQDLNVIEQHQNLIQSSIIHGKPLDILTPNPLENRKIIQGHTLVKNGNIYISEYQKTATKHSDISQNLTYNRTARNQHGEISREMCNLITSINKVGTIISNIF